MSHARTEAVFAAMSTAPVQGGLAENTTTDDIFGEYVFTLDEMRKRLPKDVYASLERIIHSGGRLDPAMADSVAAAMKEWALSKGATHYTHWFQPMTGTTAEKHDAFLSPVGDGRAISDFSGKMLISGEPDASSFPSGGLRSTFEARGYTAWDPSVPVFVIPGPYSATLHIPTFFYSYSGEALDRKIPLLRSMAALSRQALRILRLFGNTTATSVQSQVGPEQEYFLVDRNLAALRPDLLLCGRTLLGAPSPKGQELEDHYFGAIPSRVQSFMEDVEDELLRLGIPAKTRHNEVAPGQFEIAPVYEDANMACDHNMLTMNMMRHLAARHGFVCLLHEKPFAGVNGSGKHNNWSMSDSDGNNLLNPGSTPRDNAQFLVFLAAVLRAVHKHATALRLGTIGAGNDHRLGANEAPPAIISVYLGDQLNEVIESIISGKPLRSHKSSVLEIGVSSLPPLPVDLSDRNRTSPFAFTGNKFEFRAVGSSQSIAPVNIALNAAVACALDDIATQLEAAVSAGASLNQALQEFLPREFKEHMPVVFNGNGYAESWTREAAKRGLPNLNNTVDALERYSDPDVMNVFLRHGILSEREMLSRQDILLDAYAKELVLEAHVLSDLVRTRVLPPCLKAQRESCDLLLKTREAGLDAEAELASALTIRNHVLALQRLVGELDAALEAVSAKDEALARARAARETLLPLMADVRLHADAMERLVDDRDWTLPKYSELLWMH
ncbi:MAG TPA: glutamine synthetase III [Candidatus Desulfovibrio intestinipullorum]|uniref:Glutamine synthetase III n=1 Tax=Candidatus Desulfovibrio intestinipullorum TaxID=2838536 RepID=A0A9D1PUN1_9BACT|nr:glutamine synthetase III [Candidatus Desulfovibrio intestinipullorum]